jgi:hypothetical protein
MPTLVTFPEDALSARERNLWTARRQAEENFYADKPGEFLRHLFREFADATDGLLKAMERRAVRTERCLRNSLPHQIDEQRAKTLEILYGATADRRDPSTLNDVERALIGHYRQMDNTARQALRVIYERFGATGPLEAKEVAPWPTR